MSVKIELNGREVTPEELLEFLKKANHPLLARTAFGDRCDAQVSRQGKIGAKALFGGRFDFECHNPAVVEGYRIPMSKFIRMDRGERASLPFAMHQKVKNMLVNEGLPGILDRHLKWENNIENIVVNEGLQHILDILFVSATGQIDPWYIGLIDSSPTPAAGDTASGIDSSAQIWSTDQNYDEAVRQTYVDVRAAQSVTNSASKAVFTMSATTTIGGAFMISDSTKGGTSGTLLCAGAFTGGNKAVADNDTLSVTYTFTAADDA